MNCNDLDLFWLVLERLLYLLAGACVGLVVEWQWHPCDRVLTWLEGRLWRRCGRG